MGKPSNITVIKTGKTQAEIANELSERIKDVIYSYSNKIPLALAIGVLRIVERDILNDADGVE